MTDTTPEAFGAIGDGVTNDAPAIQRALDSINNSGKPSSLFFSNGKRYRCDNGLAMDASVVNLIGYGSLDFSRAPQNVIAVSVYGSITEFGNSYGYKGSITGQLQIIGPTGRGSSVCLNFESPNAGSSTHLLIENLAVTSFQTAFRFGARGYNQHFNKCEAFDCGTIFDWPSSDDNAERVTVVGGTFYNSDLAVRVSQPAGAIYLYGSSLDYNLRNYIAEGGKIFSYGVHHESNRWIDSPFTARGDGGLIHLSGGWILQQQNTGNLTYFVDVNAGSAVNFDSVTTNNTNAIYSPDASTPTTWATGAGRFIIRNTFPSFEYGGFPAKAQSGKTILADPDFEAAALGQDLIWRYTDNRPIVNRYGSPPSVPPTGTDDNLYLSRSTISSYSGSGCLSAAKTFGQGSPASFYFACIPVEYPDRVLSGFRVKLARTGSSINGTLLVQGVWLKLDGQDSNRLPIVAKIANNNQIANPAIGPSIITVTATGDWQLVQPFNGGSQVISPEWATHYAIFVDLFASTSAEYLFDGVWADRF